MALREAHSTDRVSAISEGNGPRNTGWLVFMGWVISKANKWEDYSNYFGEGVEISRSWPTFGPFMVGLGTVMAPMGVSFSICECIIMSI